MNAPAKFHIQEQTIETLIENSIDAIANVMRNGNPIALASSFGKDSSAVGLMMIAAARRVKNEGIEPMIMAMFGDTGVENPENLDYAMKEMDKLQDWAFEHKVNLSTHIARPSMASAFPLRVIGGRALPSFPGTNHDCSQSYKIDPARKLRKTILRALSREGHEAVTLLGTRFEESEARARRMTERGDSDTTPVRNKDGELVLSPIALWTTDEVWEVLAMAGSGALMSYSDFQDTFRLYADAGGTSCAVVSDAIMSSKPKAGCGARQGCHVCVAVSSDASMENFIAGDQRYAYMKGLNDIRNFIAATRWDMSRRLWIGRSIKDGYIAIRPDVYSPNMMLELLRYYLTADRDEQVRAARAKEMPKFEVIPLTTLIAIDAQWSLQAFHKPHAAFKECVDIQQNGKSFYPPKNMPVSIRPPAMPKTKYLHVGEGWNSQVSGYGNLLHVATGMRNIALEAAMGGEASGGCMGTRTLSNGNTVLDVETAESFDVDYEGAELLLAIMQDEMLERYHNSNGKTGLTEAYRFYVNMGTISLSPQQVSKHDEILSRSMFKERNGLAGADYDLQQILARCVDEKEVAMEVQETLKADVPESVQFSFDW